MAEATLELPPVSVIIPAWRAAATIGRALSSIAAQTVRPLEAVVADDGSDDGTADAAEACRRAMNGVDLVVLRLSHQGAGAARNAALRAAKGEIVAFLDADDEWLPTKIERSLERLRATGVAFVSHDMIVIDSAGRETYADSARHFAVEDPLVALLKRGFVATSTVVARRDAVLAAGGFDPDLPAAQDYDLWLAVAEGPGGFHVFGEALSRYHETASGITANVERRRRCSMAVLGRHAPAIRARKGAVCAALTRALIVQYEAASAHRARGRTLAALRTMLQVPLVAASALRAAFAPARIRPNYLSSAAAA